MAELEFVNVQGADEQQKRRNRTIVRSHVMKGVRSRLRAAKAQRTPAVEEVAQVEAACRNIPQQEPQLPSCNWQNFVPLDTGIGDEPIQSSRDPFQSPGNQIFRKRLSPEPVSNTSSLSSSALFISHERVTNSSLTHLYRTTPAPSDATFLSRSLATEISTQEVLDSQPDLTNSNYAIRYPSISTQTSPIANGRISEFTICSVSGCNAPVYETLLCPRHLVLYRTPSINRTSTVICWRFDPFLSFPVVITPEIRQVLDHVFTDRRRNIMFYRNAQFPNALICAASFHQVIANILKWMRLNRDRIPSQSYEEKHELVHYATALGSIRELMAVGATSEGLVCAVANLLAYSHLLNDTTMLIIHRQALAEIVRLRGGPHDLRPALRAFLFWVDTNVSCTLDMQPLFPIPSSNFVSQLVISSYPVGSQRILDLWRSIFPCDSDIFEIFGHVAAFSLHLDVEMANSDAEKSLQWTNWLGTLCHSLLNAQTLVDPGNPHTFISEACRLALLLFLAPIRRVLAVATFTTAVQLEKLQLLLFNKYANWHGLYELKHWVIAMGMLEAQDNEGLYQWAKLWMIQNNIQNSLSFTTLLSSVVDVMWIDALHGQRFRRVQEIFHELNQAT